MEVKEYREKHRHCKYCSHSEFGLYNYYCHAKEKDLLRNHAKRCPLYDVKWRTNEYDR